MTIQNITPKLVVADADAAIDYYQRALGASLSHRYTAGNGPDAPVVFADLMIGSLVIQLKDADDVDLAPTQLGRPGLLLAIDTEDPDAVAQAMVDAGGEVVFEVADQQYGARGGRVRDPFGHEWLIQTPVTLSPDEVQASLA